ncbi:MAG TPA: SpoIIE family protein phosphatase [Acidimicrobiales bacterium]|nr:SpoIIE family protein phosphatase [Acidimicrobiales bacterium]
MASLQRVTSGLGPLRSPAELAEIVVREGAAAIGGHTGSLCLLDESGESFELVHEVGYRRQVSEDWHSFPASAPVPAADAIRRRQIVVLESLDDRDAKYPLLAGLPATDRAFVVIPLFTTADSPLGAFTVGWPEPRRFDDDELAFLQTLGDHCAQAIERARLYEAARVAAERQAFLADASRELATSLDLETTLRRVVRLAVPKVADSAALHLLDNDGLRLVALSHVDPRGEEAMRTLSARTGDVAVDEHMLHTARTGEPLVSPDTPKEIWAEVAEDEEHLELLHALDNRSVILVSLQVEGRKLGTLLLATCWATGRRLGHADLSFVEDVAARAAVAIDNALSHRRLGRMAETLQQSLLPGAVPHVDGLDVAVYYRPVGGGIVGGDFYDVFPVAPGEHCTARWGVVIGDVAGKGVDAAALTSLVRYTARAVATVDSRPAEVLSRCNEAVLAAGVGERFATLLYATVEPLGGDVRVTMASGGHPLPVRRVAEGEVVGVGTPGPAVGLFADSCWTTDTVVLHPGDTLVLFTDGLLEARSPAGEFAPQLLEQTLRSLVGANAAATAAAVVDAVDAFEEGSPRDDLAIVVLSVPQPFEIVEVELRDVPSLVVVQSSEYLDELLRELELVRLGARQGVTGVAYPHRLLVLVDRILSYWAGSRDETRHQAEAALREGRSTVDLHLALPRVAAMIAEQFVALLDEIEEFSAKGRLLTVPPRDELRRFQRWFCEETAAQLRGQRGPSSYVACEVTPPSVGRTTPALPEPGPDGTPPKAGLRARRTLPHDLAAAAEARWALRQLGEEWGVDVDDALVPLSELVTNAVLHTGDGEVELEVAFEDGVLRVEVGDRMEDPPRPLSHELDAGTGRGLRLVAALTDRWGVLPVADGKRVWFELCTRHTG